MATVLAVSKKRQAATTASAASNAGIKLNSNRAYSDVATLLCCLSQDQGSVTATKRIPGAVRTTLRISGTLGIRQPVSDGVCRACSMNPSQSSGKPILTAAAKITGTMSRTDMGTNGNFSPPASEVAIIPIQIQRK